MDTREMSVLELISKVLDAYKDLGYSRQSVDKIRSVYKELAWYCTQHNELTYSLELMERFQREVYDEEHGDKERHWGIKRAVNMLHDYRLFGAVLRKSKKERVFKPQFAESCEWYIESLLTRNLGERTVYNHRLSLIRFTDYLDSHGVASPEEIRMDHISGFIKLVIRNFSNRRMGHELNVVKCYVKLLFERGRHLEDLSGKVPKMPAGSTYHNIPSAYSKDEVARMLACVERDSPVGKRDYAVLLLASRLGLRASDVRSLTFDNIDWDNALIRIVQTKTGEPLTLPLVPEVGWALIEYIQHSRPQTEAKELFVRLRPPHTQMSNFNAIVIKYLHRAGIAIEAHKHHGLHSLRHSLATRLLEESTPLHVIQEVLGHLNAESTSVYMGVDIGQLKQCALEVPNESR
jgi:site-specific recombinase XerD